MTVSERSAADGQRKQKTAPEGAAID